MYGQDAQWEGEPFVSTQMGAEDICQRDEDFPLNLDSLHMHIYPQKEKCEVNKTEQSCSFVYDRLHNQAGQNYGSKRKSREKYIKDCQEYPYFNQCMYEVQYKHMTLWFQYPLKFYPLDKKDEAEKLLMKYLSVRDISNKQD